MPRGFTFSIAFVTEALMYGFLLQSGGLSLCHLLGTTNKPTGSSRNQTQQ